MASKKSGFWRKIQKIKDTLLQPAHKTARLIFTFATGIILIFFMALSIFMSSLFLSKPFPLLGILTSSILCSFCTVPLTLILRPIVKEAHQKSEDKKDALLQTQQRQLELIQEENDALKDTEKTLEEKIRLLENLTFNMETYNDVFKLCFREYSQSGTIKNKEIVNEEDFSGTIKKLLNSPSKNYDEIVSVMDYEVKYQRGVDLQDIKIAKINKDTVVISGIKPKYTTRPVFEYKEFLNEMRHVTFNHLGELKKIRVEQDDSNKRELAQKQNEYKAIFEDSFLEGRTNEDDSGEIIKRAQNFISIILQPIYRHIEFDETPLAKKSMPLLEYLHTELSEYEQNLRTSAKVSEGAKEADNVL